MFADGHLLTQLIPLFCLWKFGDFIDLDPDWIILLIFKLLQEIVYNIALGLLFFCLQLKDFFISENVEIMIFCY